MATILALDDLLDAGNLLRRILELGGHAVEVFTDEEAALAYVRRHPPDLAILDIKLKKMSGVEVLAKLKQICPGTRVIMLTGYPTRETASAARELGADAYCVKPIDQAELEATVAEVLAKGRASERRDG